MMPPSLMCLLEVYLGNIYCLHVGNVCLFVHPSICPKAKITQPLRIIPICHHACICISLHLPVPFWIFLYLPAFLWISLDLSDLSHHNYQPFHHAFQPISYHTHQPSSTSTLTIMPISHHAYKPSCQSAFIPTICNYAYQKSCHQTSSLTAIIPKLLSFSACFNPAIIQRMPSKCICISVEWYFWWKWPCRKWPSRMSFQVNTFQVKIFQVKIVL